MFHDYASTSKKDNIRFSIEATDKHWMPGISQENSNTFTCGSPKKAAAKAPPFFAERPDSFGGFLRCCYNSLDCVLK